MMKSNLIALLLGLSTVIWIGCSSSESDTTDATNTNTDQVTTTARTLTDQSETTQANHPAMYVSAVDLDGQSHQFAEWIGQKPLVINFWGTWCPPCRREIPGLVRLYGEYHDRGIEIISLAIERQAGPVQVNQFAERAGMTWVQLMANEDALRAFGYDGAVPLTVFLDKNGREVARHRGGRPYEVFKQDFKKLAASI